ncbi:hypothetical protein HD806DRAFT_520234 [Xylariaceae sp. AK1471]|nr:hypothetical protein HD806DRAFT_520234 [Xylariaceae sp. AK1471]
MPTPESSLDNSDIESEVDFPNDIVGLSETILTLEPQTEAEEPTQTHNHGPLPQASNHSNYSGVEARDGTISSFRLPNESINLANNDSRLSLQKSLGVYGSLIIMGGTLVNIGIWGFLLFLWLGEGHAPNGAQAPSFWRFLMLDGWVTQAITLSSLVLRLVVAAQATVCTSMLASLVLENHHVPLSQVARYSILRGINDGPWGFLRLTFSRFRFLNKIFLRIETFLAVILFSAALAINFSSTVLLSDLRFAQIANDQETTLVNLVFNPNTTVFLPSTEYWTQRPRAYATFGEINPGVLASPNELGVSGTGVVRRVFLPIPDASKRSTISRYAGAAWVVSSTTTCMPPVIGGLISGATTNGGVNSGFGQFVGNISYESTFKQAGLAQIPLCDDQKCLPTQFECAVAGASGYPSENQAGHDWVYSFCFLPSHRNYTDPDNIEPSSWSLDESPVAASSSVHLVLATNGASSFWKLLGNSTFSTKPFQRYNEWDSYKLGQGLYVNASICLSTVNVTVSQVILHAQGEIKEPVINFDKSTKQWDTSAVRAQLGTDRSVQDFGERGIFEVETISDIIPEGTQNALQPFSSTVAERATSVLQNALGSDTFPLIDETDHTVNLCEICTKYGTGVDREITTLIRDILQYTKSVATAILSTWSVLGQTYFFDLLDLLDVPGEAEIVLTTNVQIPLQRRGLIVISTILAVELACAVTITVLFIRKTRYSRQGNVWHAISQIVCHETEAALAQCNEMEDDGITNFMKDNDHSVKLARSLDNGRVEVARVSFHTHSRNDRYEKGPQHNWYSRFRSKGSNKTPPTKTRH